MLSPPTSSARSASTTNASPLPHPRAHPLKAGSSKESTFIRHVDQQLLYIQRRFAKRTSPDLPYASHTLNDDAVAEPPDSTSYGKTWKEDAKGYSSMRPACRDIEELVDLIWISGTPSLQIPYLINLALLLSTIVTSMPPSPKELFMCLGKLDRCFASLIQGRDIDSGEALPGFDGFGGARGVSMTEKVRIRSVVERTRVGIMEAFKRGEFDLEADEEKEGAVDAKDVDVDMDGDLVIEGEELNTEDEDEEDESWDMQLARVYDRTIQELGDTLEGERIGIRTEPMG